MNWKIAEAKQRFSELILSTLKEPQLIYNCDHLVAVVIEPKSYAEFLAWRERQSPTSIAEALQELQKLCLEEDYTLTILPRQDRSNAFFETNELSI
jgi:hypothetical protein